MSYREYEAIVFDVSPIYSIKDVEKFQKVVNEKHFRFHYLDDYNMFVYNPSVKIIKKGQGWTFVAKMRQEKGPNWMPTIQRLDKPLSDIEKMEVKKAMADAPEIYKEPFWARVEVIDAIKVSRSK